MNPHDAAICPVCNGSTRVPVPADQQRYKTITAGYDAATDTFACHNCGGQTMWGKATGRTTIDPETGLGCVHQFVGENAGRCYTVYTCKKCKMRYDIDSGD